VVHGHAGSTGTEGGRFLGNCENDAPNGADRWSCSSRRSTKEKASGRSTNGQPELEKAIAALGTGDVLVLPEWDRATRSMLDGIQIIQRAAARGALVKVLDTDHPKTILRTPAPITGLARPT
jgi:Resolvase, N terminal domain